ncbi:MAG: hypothetical protein D6677_09565 [Calditrichaeota bacterium]|nr:MAG: hypothetical protein D6677_09565 [Calditrichota bacterium]
MILEIFKEYTIKYLTLIIALFCTTSYSIAQEYELGVDVVSRYVWRGVDLAPGAAMQPAFSISAGGFSVGSWASYAISPQAAGADEHDFWVSYAFGPVTLTATDYYFPGSNARFFNYDNNGKGAHVLEAAVGYEGPVSLLFAANVYNDTENSLYMEIGWESESGVGLAAGITKGTSAWYAVSGDGLAVTHVTVRYQRDIKITQDFSLPVSGQIIVNPTLEKSFFVVGFSL